MILVVTGGCAGVADGRAVWQGEGLVVDILGPLRRGRLAIVSSGASVFAPRPARLSQRVSFRPACRLALRPGSCGKARVHAGDDDEERKMRSA